MKFDQIRPLVKKIPYISAQNARYLYDLIVREKITRILELGIAHGTATCYMAAALDELGGGSITAVDLLEVKDYFKPSAEELLPQVGLDKYVNIVRGQTGYVWFLHDEIKRLTTNDICAQEYDLCIIDGPKNWTIDGCAFFLVDKILKENGWLIFDDYNWTYASEKREVTDGVTHRNLSEDERTIPQIQEVFDLLVKQHPNYSDFQVFPETDWAIARKKKSDKKKYTVEYHQTHRDILLKKVRDLKNNSMKMLKRTGK